MMHTYSSSSGVVWDAAAGASDERIPLVREGWHVSQAVHQVVASHDSLVLSSWAIFNLEYISLALAHRGFLSHFF
jgi:hypothetical protein